MTHWNNLLNVQLLAEGDPPTLLEPLGMWLPFIMVGVLFYVLMVLPERKKRKKHEAMLGNLKKNDRVVTIGGIYGTIVNIARDAEDVTIKIDENSNTRLRITRSSIGRVIQDADSDSNS